MCTLLETTEYKALYLKSPLRCLIQCMYNSVVKQFIATCTCLCDWEDRYDCFSRWQWKELGARCQEEILINASPSLRNRRLKVLGARANGTRDGDTRGEMERVPLARPILSSAWKLLASVCYAGEYASLSDIPQLTISRVKGPHKSWRHVITHVPVGAIFGCEPLLSYEVLLS